MNEADWLSFASAFHVTERGRERGERGEERGREEEESEPAEPLSSFVGPFEAQEE